MAERRSRKSAAKAGPSDRRVRDDAQVYLVFGEEEYLVGKGARELVDRLCPPADQAFGLETVDGEAGNTAEAVEALRRGLEALQTVGFLGGRKVVWLRGATFFGKAACSESEEVKTLIERLTGLIKGGLSEGQVLVVSAPKVDGRSAFFKACQAAGEVVRHDRPDKPYQMEEYARDMAERAFSEEGLKAGVDVMEHFLAKAGTDTRQIVQEARKLALYLGGRKDVTQEDIRAIVSPAREAVAWDLADAVGHRKLAEALRILRQLVFQGENPVGILVGLEYRFREMVLYRSFLDRKWLVVSGREPWLKVEWRSSPEIDRVLSSLPRNPRQTNPYRAGKLLEQARKYTAQELERCRAVLVEAHEALVTSALPKDMLLEFLLLRLLGPGPVRATGVR